MRTTPKEPTTNGTVVFTIHPALRLLAFALAVLAAAAFLLGGGFGAVWLLSGGDVERTPRISCLRDPHGSPVVIDSGRAIGPEADSFALRYEMLCGEISSGSFVRGAKPPGECLFDDNGKRVIYRQRRMRLEGDPLFDVEWSARCLAPR